MAIRGFLVFLLVQMAMTMEIPTQCERDTDCPQHNGEYFCDFSHYCERCLPCEEILHRHPLLSETGQKMCAKTQDDCGVCLLGYESEDLVDQRRSFQCFPVIAESLNSSTNNQLYVIAKYVQLPIPALMIVIVVVMIWCILIFISAIGCFFHKNQRNLNATSGFEREENCKLVDRLPPPYELPGETGVTVSPERATERHYLTTVISEHLNQATPIEPYHNAKLITNLEDTSPLPVRENQVGTNEDGNGSTETIPSLWEPSSVMDLNVDGFSRPLIRCQSLEFPRLDRVSHKALTNSISDPALPIVNGRRRSTGESYAHRHIRLSMHRLSVPRAGSQATFGDARALNAASITPTLSDQTSQCDEDFEPGEPESFVYDGSQVSMSDTSFRTDFMTISPFTLTGSLFGRPISSSTPTTNPGGSQDSGFFDQSRRRRANADANFELTFFMKRPREFE